jgi:hypothetical protein
VVCGSSRDRDKARRESERTRADGAAETIVEDPACWRFKTFGIVL